MMPDGPRHATASIKHELIEDKRLEQEEKKQKKKSKA